MKLINLGKRLNMTNNFQFQTFREVMSTSPPLPRTLEKTTFKKPSIFKVNIKTALQRYKLHQISMKRRILYSPAIESFWPLKITTVPILYPLKTPETKGDLLCKMLKHVMLTNPCFYIFGDAFRALHFYCTHFQAIFSFNKIFINKLLIQF